MTQLATMSKTTDAETMDLDLLEARENFATILRTSPAVLCIIQLNSLRYCEINNAYEHSTGYSRSEVLGKVSLGLGLWANVKDRDHMFRMLLAHGHIPRHKEVFQTKKGEPLITLLSAEIIQFDGRPCALMVAEDITRHQQAEEARVVLVQRLIDAQEAECKRVGRELHDCIGHSLAMLTMDLEMIRLSLVDAAPDSNARLTRFSNKLKNLGQDVATVSHRLHSSTLELLGLAVAVKALSRDFSEQYQVQASCECSSVPDNLAADVSLCLFRVMQETLHNIAKHSRAAKIEIELDGNSDYLHLSISDDGVGFARDAISLRPGLGLISMRERVQLIGGEFIIASKPGSGTRVEAIVPLAKASFMAVQPQSSWSHVNCHSL
jgi:PAS domain S-box-containing protein